ncbi:type II toxin-antitoxin system HicB family antitoxin [Halorientalis halophila]|uniref:type II toxin-antitoxin system HicB family antitoxin n=1 Tax=Halorientalis halophila TaxID=3108499 RepID=UPI0030080DB7
MASSTRPDDESRTDEVHLWREDDAWIARDIETGIASQGDSRGEALEMLDEAIALHEGDAGRPVTDEDLEALGIDPDSVPDEPQEPDAPWFDSET